MFFSNIKFFSYLAIVVALACFTNLLHQESTFGCEPEIHDICLSRSTAAHNCQQRLHVSFIRQQLLHPNDDYVIVIAHRGDWRNAPENSLQAIGNCIRMGVDVVEIDVRKTKDDQLVLIHDKTLDRTTTGTGLVADYNLEEIKQLFLKNGQGKKTRHRIPTLKEAMLLAKDKIIVNLDKCYDNFEFAYQVLEETGTLDQIILKGSADAQKVKSDLGSYLEDLIYMPIVHLDEEDAWSKVEELENELNPVAFEFVFKNYSESLSTNFLRLRNNGTRVWVNSLWPYMNAGHDDDLAVINADASYGWILCQGANMVQTDRPALLLDYLNKNGLHDLTKASANYKKPPESQATIQTEVHH